MATLEQTWIVTNISALHSSRTSDPRYADKAYRTVWFANGADYKTVRKTYVTQGMANEHLWDPVFQGGVGTVLQGLKLQGTDRINGDSSETLTVIGRLTQAETRLFVRTGMTDPKRDIPETYPTFGNGLFEYAD